MVRVILSFGVFLLQVMYMGNYRIDPKKQFSKRLAKWTAVFWFFYMVLLIAVMIIEPSSSLYTVYMGIICTVVMLLNVYSYNKNSLTEKALLTALDKCRMEVSIGGKGKAKPEETEEEEGGSNG